MLVALFVLGIFLLAPSAQALADPSTSQTTESSSQKISENQISSTVDKNRSDHNRVSNTIEIENERKIQDTVKTLVGEAEFKSQLKGGNQ